MKQKLWLFKDFRRSLGKADICWSQPIRVDHMCKNMWARRKKNCKGEVQDIHARLVGNLPPPLFCNFWIFLNLSFWDIMRMGLGFWENGRTTLPFFEPCPYTWEGEIYHSSWSLEISFFPFLGLKLECTQTFISTIGIFVL